MQLRTTTLALLVLRAARAHDCGATAGARSAALVKGAAALRDLAFLHGSTDNISALVVDLSAVAP